MIRLKMRVYDGVKDSAWADHFKNGFVPWPVFNKLTKDGNFIGGAAYKAHRQYIGMLRLIDDAIMKRLQR